MGEVTLAESLRLIEDILAARRYGDARAQCLALLEQAPRALRAQRLLAEVSLAQGLLAEADTILRRVLRADPEDALAVIGLALIAERRNDHAGALRCYHQACELRPGNRHMFREHNRLAGLLGQPAFQLSRAGLARLYMRGGLWNRALLEWHAVLRQFPRRLDAQIGLLETLWRLNEAKALEMACRETLREAEQCLKALLLLGAQTTLDDRPEGARRLFQEVVALDPDLVMARALFADLAREQRDTLFAALAESTPARALDAIATLPHVPAPAPRIEALPTMVVPAQQPPEAQRPDSTPAAPPTSANDTPSSPGQARNANAGTTLDGSESSEATGDRQERARLAQLAATNGEAPRLPSVTQVLPGQPLRLPSRAESPGGRGALPERGAVPDVDYGVQLTRATTLRLHGQLPEALSLYQEILKFAPDLATQVISELQAVADHTPERGPVYRLLGDAYLRQGNYLQALEAYNQSLALVHQQ